MALNPAKAVKGKNVLIQFGDGESSESFAHICSVNSARGIVFTAETNQTRVPDCDDPEIIGWFRREKVAKGATLNGAGVLHTPNAKTLFTWFDQEDSINCRIKLNGVTLANGGGHWAGAFLMTNYEVSGEVGEYTQFSGAWENDGAVTWVDASA